LPAWRGRRGSRGEGGVAAWRGSAEGGRRQGKEGRGEKKRRKEKGKRKEKRKERKREIGRGKEIEKNGKENREEF
jgi:hypothetical protein